MSAIFPNYLFGKSNQNQALPDHSQLDFSDLGKKTSGILLAVGIAYAGFFGVKYLSLADQIETRWRTLTQAETEFAQLSKTEPWPEITGLAAAELIREKQIAYSPLLNKLRTVSGNGEVTVSKVRLNPQTVILEAKAVSVSGASIADTAAFIDEIKALPEIAQVNAPEISKQEYGIVSESKIKVELEIKK